MFKKIKNWIIVKWKYLLVVLGLSVSIVFAAGELPIIEDTTIVYKNDNITVEFINNDIIIGQATLKSHKTYDEILKITTGKNKTVIWYEFSDFKNIQENALIDVEFIDMREFIVNDSKEEEPEIIPNPDYLLPVEKDYNFVYLENGEWIDYNSTDIPKENIIIGVQTDLGWGEYLDVVFNIFENKLSRHALVIGTNAGFVTEAPTADPLGSTTTIDTRAYTLKDTSPVGAIKITEIGWFTGNATEESNFEVAIYTHNAGDNEAEAVVGSVSSVNAKGTSAGWKVVSGLNITISPETVYWLGVQLDDTASATSIDYTANAGARYGLKLSQTSLTDPWGTSLAFSARFLAIYAVYEEAPPVEEEEEIKPIPLGLF